MPKCDFNKVALKRFEATFPYGSSPVNLLHIFRTLFPKNTSRRLLLKQKAPQKEISSSKQ